MSKNAKRGRGRPRSSEPTKTTNLCGVRVTPYQLAAYRATAGLRNMPLSTWVTNRLDSGIAPEVFATIAANGATLKERAAAMGWTGPATTERYDRPKKTKGRK